ncbi:hypothetical protein EVAR_18470_1 [Eumeta japonica]|uniref:Uncharacterized protein n=1 Tax=Eumeta variegata TaxID=151549 RepID=A0A4C1UZN2_EUMVA|nr:hypothetical protein EVAR_18470_1 [Eumeta japonica]
MPLSVEDGLLRSSRGGIDESVARRGRADVLSKSAHLENAVGSFELRQRERVRVAKTLTGPAYGRGIYYDGGSRGKFEGKAPTDQPAPLSMRPYSVGTGDRVSTTIAQFESSNLASTCQNRRRVEVAGASAFTRSAGCSLVTSVHFN